MTHLERPRFGLGLDINFQEFNPRVPMTDEEVEEKYDEIRRRSGVLRILDREYRAELGDIEWINELGRGAFGVVRKASFKRTGTLMAVKIIPITGNAESNKRTVMDMDVIMRSHACPHIVRCYGCFVSDSEVRICMELMTMCLDKLLKKAKEGFPEIIVGKITNSVLLALKYLKDSERIMHRDIKPSNILIDLAGTIKICDFGISGRLIDSNKAETNTKGCTAYLAPERVGISENEYGVLADVWSLGITLIELATGRHPYDGCNNDFELLTKINTEPPPKIDSSSGFSKPFCSFIALCLKKRPTERANYNRLLKEPFVVLSREDGRIDVSTWFQDVMSQ